MTPRLQKNLSILRKSHPTLFNLVQNHPPVDLIEPGWMDEGTWGLRGRDQVYPIGESADSKEANILIETIRRSTREGMDFVYINGLGNGYILTAIAEEFTQTNRGILVIEPCLDVFHCALRCSDLSKILANKRIFFAVGEGVKENIHSILDTTLCPAASKPAFHIGYRLHNSKDREKRNALTAFIHQEVKRRKENLLNQVRHLPQLVSTPNDGPPRVWCYLDLRGRARYSLIQHTLIRTLMYYLHQNGFETEYTALYDDCYYPPYYRILKMAQFKPDLIFLCNETPSYSTAVGEELSQSLPIPKVIWFADDPLYGEHLMAKRSLDPSETFLIADYEWAYTLKKHGASRIEYMPGAATKRRRGRKRGSRTCDIVFVGQVRDQSVFFENLSSGWRRYCQQVVMEKIRFPRKKVRDVMAQYPMPGELPLDRLDEFRQKLLWEANTQFRLHVISQLKEYDLRIYGNTDWLRLLSSEIASRCFRGVLRFQRLFEVYRNARITLNIHSLQSYTCMNVRDFDAPAAGGFLVSDWLPKADEIFQPGFVSDLPMTDESTEEVFFYRSIPELHAIVEYFLSHEEQRQRCIERARRKVLANHTYLHRAEWLGVLFCELLYDSN